MPIGKLSVMWPISFYSSIIDHITWSQVLMLEYSYRTRGVFLQHESYYVQNYIFHTAFPGHWNIKNSELTGSFRNRSAHNFDLLSFPSTWTLPHFRKIYYPAPKKRSSLWHHGWWTSLQHEKRPRWQSSIKQTQLSVCFSQESYSVIIQSSEEQNRAH
jgi:hypothetical protein